MVTRLTSIIPEIKDIAYDLLLNLLVIVFQPGPVYWAAALVK